VRDIKSPANFHRHLPCLYVTRSHRSAGLTAAFLGLFASGIVSGLDTARMRLPDGFGGAEHRLEFDGFGGHNKGRYAIGAYSGEFTRSESRLGIFDPLYASNSGKSTFTFLRANAASPIEASCEFRKKSVTVGIVTFDPKKMHVNCDFRQEARPVGLRFGLGQPKPANMKERLLARSARRGEALIDDRYYTIESVHHYAGSKLSSQSPVGYTIAIDSRVVGALELTDWNPGGYLEPDLGDEIREDLLIVMLALAVIRDPANSVLEDQADLD